MGDMLKEVVGRAFARLRRPVGPAEALALAEHEVLLLKTRADRDPPVPCSVSLWRRPAAPG